MRLPDQGDTSIGTMPALAATMIDAWTRTPERDSGTGGSKRRMSRCGEPLIVLFHHRHNLANSPPISTGDRDAE